MRQRLAWVALLVAVLVFVPTLVRATQSFNRDSGTIRLNRGFDGPESKSRVAPPAVVLPAAVVMILAAPRIVVIARPVFVDDPLPSSQLDISPSVLRGPPLATTL